MDVSHEEKLPPPPGVINSIRAGFDAVATHVMAILFPLLLNLFMWLGPRLSMVALFDSAKNDMISVWKSGGFSTADIQRALDLYQSTIPSINLFWLLRTFPIGISSLLFPLDEKTPLGLPVVIQVNALNLFGWIFLVTLVGWIGGGLYFRSIARLVANADTPQVSVSRAVIQTIFLSIAWGILLTMISIPLMILLAVLMQINQALANVAVLFFSFAAMWVIVPLFFWAHGVFLKKQNAITSLLSSLQIVRFTLPVSSLFVLTIFLLAFGLNYLWNIPSKDSWMTLIGIFGHSFVTTALLASSFIYYRDVTIWLQIAMEKSQLSAVKKA